MKTLCCLFCGRELKLKGWGRHQTRRSHDVEDKSVWWKYDVMGRLLISVYKREMLSSLKRRFVFSEIIHKAY